jgi:hypothetical protein
VLVDGGYFNRDSVTRLTQAGVELLMPLREPKKADRDAGAPMDRDTAEVAALRRRMQDPATKPRYQERARWIEWVNAGARNRGLYWFGVRGLVNVRTVLGWQAMAHNFRCILRSKTLRAVLGLPQPCTA